MARHEITAKQQKTHKLKQNNNKRGGGNKNGRLKKVDFGPVLDRGFWAILAGFVWLLRALPEKNSPPAGPANHGGGK